MKQIVIVAYYILLGQLTANLSDAPDKQSTPELIARVRKDLTDLESLSALARRTDDPQVVPALEDAFARAKASDLRNRSEYQATRFRLSQFIAVSLIERGVKDVMYFDELGKYALEAVSANPPPAYLMDEQGREDPRRGPNPEFVGWCASRSQDFQTCLGSVLAYDQDLSWLVAAHDERAVPILREALRASDLVMVGWAVRGLAELNDSGSIPLVLEACQRLPPARARWIASYAIPFRDARAVSIYDRCITDASAREAVKKEWVERLAATPGQEKRK